MQSRQRILSGIVLISIWFLLVICLTLVNREQTGYATYNLKLFWCIEEAWMTKNADDWYCIWGNIALFIPSGLIFPLFFYSFRKLWRTVVFNFSFSVTIELVQLVWHLGLFEFDDMFHNTLGAAMGYGLFLLVAKYLSLDVYSPKLEKLFLLFIWIFVFLVIVIALISGQPVFDYIMLFSSGTFEHFYEPC